MNLKKIITLRKTLNIKKFAMLFFVGLTALMLSSYLSKDYEFETSAAWLYRQAQIIENPIVREESLTLLLHITEPDVQSLEMPINILPFGIGNRGVSIGNNFQPLNDIDIFLDIKPNQTSESQALRLNGNDKPSYVTTTGNQNLYLTAGQPVGAVNGSIMLSTIGDQKLQTFPFDRYEGWLVSWANYYPLGRPDALDPEQMEPIPLNVNIENAVFETFKMKVKLLDGFAVYNEVGPFDGPLSQEDKQKSFPDTKVGNSVTTGFELERKSTIKFIVLLIYGLILMTTFSVLLVTNSILKKRRPPALSAAIWGIAVIFTTLQMRNLMPGNPSLGIYLDVAIYFPSILAVAICSTILIASWLRREDYFV